jgi:hypothetical protein
MSAGSPIVGTREWPHIPMCPNSAFDLLYELRQIKDASSFCVVRSLKWTTLFTWVDESRLMLPALNWQVWLTWIMTGILSICAAWIAAHMCCSTAFTSWGVITRKDLLLEVQHPSPLRTTISCISHQWFRIPWNPSYYFLWRSTTVTSCVLLHVLEERESLEEIMSSRGRLGPKAWQTLFFVHVCSPCPSAPSSVFTALAAKLNVALKPSQFFRGIA